VVRSRRAHQGRRRCAPKPTREKAQNFTMIETGVVMYQGLTQTTNWWIDDLAVGPKRIGCN
jgi:hypothetical protein